MKRGKQRTQIRLKWYLFFIFFLNAGFILFVLHKVSYNINLTPEGNELISKPIQKNSIHNSNQIEDGWKDIQVFYGDKIHGREDGGSQTGQDKLIAALFRGKKNGFFIDLAANDATSLSNSFQLEKQHDWNGICIEPNSVYWRGLSYRKCQVVAAVTSQNRMEEVEFAIPKNGKRGESGAIRRDPNSKPKAKVEKYFTVPLLEILQRNKAPAIIDYLSLDVEGSEYYVLKDFPFDLFSFRTATIEKPTQPLIDLLYGKNYEYLAGNNEVGEETLWVHRSFKDSLDLKAITRLGWLTGSTKRYPRSEPGAKPVLDEKGTGNINGNIYKVNENALLQ